MLTSLEKKGVKVREILLEVGYGTYKEIKDDCIRIRDGENFELGNRKVKVSTDGEGFRRISGEIDKISGYSVDCGL